ncbi:MAG: hypothetical protein ABI939_05560, partial [Anaerolineaceae bacterium]
FTRLQRTAKAATVLTGESAFFGPLFVLGGFLAAFTEVGAVLVFSGLAMLVTGILLCTPLQIVFAVAAAVIVFAGLTVQMVVRLKFAIAARI